MWICKKCKEENEDTFDSCWNCQTIAEKDLKKVSDIQIELKENDAKQVKEEDEIKRLREQIYNSLQSYKTITYPLGVIIAGICFSLPSFLESFELVEITLNNFIVAPFSIFIGFFVSDYMLNKFFRPDVIKKLKLDKHKNYNELILYPDIEYKIILIGIICITIGFFIWFGGREVDKLILQ